MLNWVITGSVLILAVLLIRALARGRAPARAVYALWLLAALRLLLPGSIELDSPVSTLTGAVERAPVVQLTEKLIGAQSISLTPDGELEAHYAEPGEQTVIIAEHATERDFDLMAALMGAKRLLLPAWLVGAAATALIFLASWHRFSREVRRRREPFEINGLGIPVYVTDAVDTPCLFGLVRPAIYLTREAAEDERLLLHAVAHEYAHYRQRDHVWCLVRAACLALHWYNPLVWLAARLSRRDCELACDERAVRSLGERERAGYGRSLIRLTSERARGAAVATTMCARPNELKERIIMLTRKKRSIIAMALALLLAVSATACSFTGTKDNDEAGSVVPVEGDNIEYEFTVPKGTEYIDLTSWEYAGDEWRPLVSGGWACLEDSGSFAFAMEDGREEILGEISYDGAGDGGPDSYAKAFDYSGRFEAGSPGLVREKNALSPALDEYFPLVMLHSAPEGSDVGLKGFSSPEELPDADAYYYCITARFCSEKPETVSLDVSEYEEFGKISYNFTAPEPCGVYIRGYELSDGAWELFDSCKYLSVAEAGTLSFDALTPGEVKYSASFGGEEPGEAKSSYYTLSGAGIALNLDGGSVEPGAEKPVLVLYTGSSGPTPGTAYFMPETLGADSGYICYTVTFVPEGMEMPEESVKPEPTEVPIDQGRELLGFETRAVEDESYSDVINRWVREYASNLVQGLPEDDPFACSGVSIREAEVLGFSLTSGTMLESISARIAIGCTPRNPAEFVKQFDVLTAGDPIPGSGEESQLVIERFVTLCKSNGKWVCDIVSTDPADEYRWGYFCLESRRDMEYVSALAEEGCSAEEILARVNYLELRRLSYESWSALLDAADEAAISPVSSLYDQIVRDIYVLLIAANSDGAFTEGALEIIDRQREADASTFKQAYEAVKAMDFLETPITMLIPEL